MYVPAMTNIKDVMLAAEFNITVEVTASGPQPSLWARLRVSAHGDRRNRRMVITESG
jgi:hypothetical protein